MAARGCSAAPARGSAGVARRRVGRARMRRKSRSSRVGRDAAPMPAGEDEARSWAVRWRRLRTRRVAERRTRAPPRAHITSRGPAGAARALRHSDHSRAISCGVEKRLIGATRELAAAEALTTASSALAGVGHTPHDSWQLCSMYAGLFLQWPSRAHTGHCRLISTHGVGGGDGVGSAARRPPAAASLPPNQQSAYVARKSSSTRIALLPRKTRAAR
mmetsp:Transcript_41036/g.133014  ORF Transcript_41036/g.133014 Transcript_41036/m.133014 type:complete len:217 (+) Transcript_41036:238-888(+)